MAQATDNQDKPKLVEFKNGKLILKQKILSYEKMSETMQEIVKFREMLELMVDQGQQVLEEIPEEHKPLMAKLVHESEKTLQALTKHIHRELLPVNDEDDSGARTTAPILSLEAVEVAINSIAARNNYGLDSVPNGAKVPAALHVWRWEVLDGYRDWLPRAAKEKAETRLAERRQAKQEATALFASLSEEEQNTLLGNKAGTRTPLKWKPVTKPKEQPVIDLDHDAEIKTMTQSPAKKPTTGTEENGNGSEGVENAPKGSGRLKKAVDPEKAAKEKERQEKKAAKAEKDRKEKEAQDKSRSLIFNFFGKTKTASSTASTSSAKTGCTSVAGPSVIQSDFQRTFKPFVLKKDAEMAPYNWFRQSFKGKEKVFDNVIVLDGDDEVKQEPTDDVVMHDLHPPRDRDVSNLSAEGRLQEILSSLPRSLHPIRRNRRSASYLKSYSPYTVRNIMSELNEAEVAGDDTRVRSLLALLRNRRLIPAKVLIFSEDARPGYFGTWTRNSREVGPRTPFARDVVSLDYAYDSGEEWEEESGDADDVVEDAEEDDGAGDEEDSDLDSWLVDDDEVEDPGTPVEEREDSVDVFAMPPPAVPKRKVKAESENTAKQTKKRKVVVPLVPFTKGPCWESRIGECTYDLFESYQIHLLNDTQYPIDPFTFVSTPITEHTKESAAPQALFVAPAIPPHISSQNPFSPSFSATAAAPFAATSSPTSKRSAPAPKTTFPDTHLPLLLARIGTLATSSLTYIVEAVHQELKEQRVKKNAIEAKIREVGEKDKVQKIWVVKADVKATHGIA